jgi:lipopolysaccharide biosynthesis protein
MKPIAFYLPQFHPIPENDRWWGKGFTEWTNVTRSKPLFAGHYQPHLPADMGFYDLRVPEVMAQQAELAASYGIYGFCFYYYWFNGKRLLEKPVENYLKHIEIDFPFCLAYTNENWTRRWDGADQEVLIAQTHSPEDSVAFIESVIPYFKDPRYIRIDGKPMFLVYHCAAIPDIEATVRRWKAACRQHGIEDLYVCKVEALGDFREPATIGFDAALEFPPHNLAVSMEVRGAPGTLGSYDYIETARAFMRRERPNHALFRGVMTSWDNTPRRGEHGTVFLRSSPTAYRDWLGFAMDDTAAHHGPSEQFVFINAWNEWAEGAHLEPCQVYGHGFLQATLSALQARGFATHLPPSGFQPNAQDEAELRKETRFPAPVRLIKAIVANRIYQRIKVLIPLGLRQAVARRLAG